MEAGHGLFDTGAADWVQGQFSEANRRPLTPFQRQAVNILVKAMKTGPWNLTVNWQRVQWNHGDGGGGVRFVLAERRLATFDFDHLTRLVLAAHDACVRVAIEPCTFRHLAITMHPRDGRDGSYYASHPTIETAIEHFRGKAT